MMGNIQNIAGNIAAKISSGEMSLADLNIQALGQQVASAMTSEDMEQFANSMSAEGDPALQMKQLGFMFQSLQKIVGQQ